MAQLSVLRRACVFAAVGIALGAQPVRSDDAAPVLKVYGTQVRAIVIAAPLPQVSGGAVDHAWLSTYDARLRAALAFHGAFAPLDHAAELPDPAAVDGLTAKTWRAAGAEILLRAQVVRSEGLTKLDVYLFDVANDSTVWAQRYSMAQGGAAELADAVAGGVIEKLLGVPSLFDKPIVFQYRAPGQRWRELYTTDWSGVPLKQLTTGQRLVLNPAWATGNRVLAIGYANRIPALALFDLSRGSFREVLRSESNLHGPALLPDGRAIVAWERQQNNDLYLVNLETGEAERLTTGTAADLSPTVSPDGKRVAFVSDMRGNPYLFVLDLETRKVQPLVLEGMYLGEPDWSADGERIAFVRRDRGTGFAIWQLDVAKNSLTQLTDDGGDSLESPAWAVDNRTIVFSRLASDTYNLFKVDRLLKQTAQLTRFSGDARMPDWKHAR